VRKGLALSALWGVLAGLAMPAHAGLFDSLFAKKDDLGPATQREWRLDEFTIVRLAPKEAEAPANQQPATVDVAALRNQLASVQVSLRDGSEALFDADELAQLAPYLSRALSLAGPNDDVLLLSTARRGGRFSVPDAITARLFVQGDALNLIVHDARVDFIIAYRNSRVEPKFVYGSRKQAGTNPLRSASAMSQRADWLAIPLSSLSGTSVAAAPAPAKQVPTPVAAAVPPAVTPAPAPASPAAIGDDIEQRLLLLKRLRDKGLISEEEYQQKRRDVLQKL